MVIINLLIDWIMVLKDMTNPGLIWIFSELKSLLCSVNQTENDKNILVLQQNDLNCPLDYALKQVFESRLILIPH